MSHHRSVSKKPASTRTRTTPQTPPTEIELESAFDAKGRQAAISKIVDAVHAARAVLGKGTLTGRMKHPTAGEVTITGRMCAHSDAVKLDLKGPGGHREVCVPWKRDHQQRVSEAASILLEVLQGTGVRLSRPRVAVAS